MVVDHRSRLLKQKVSHSQTDFIIIPIFRSILIIMSSHLKIFALVILVALLVHVANATAVADESLDTAVESGAEISAAVENDFNTEFEASQQLAEAHEEDLKKRRCIDYPGC